MGWMGKWKTETWLLSRVSCLRVAFFLSAVHIFTCVITPNDTRLRVLISSTVSGGGFGVAVLQYVTCIPPTSSGCVFPRQLSQQQQQRVFLPARAQYFFFFIQYGRDIRAKPSNTRGDRGIGVCDECVSCRAVILVR